MSQVNYVQKAKGTNGGTGTVASAVFAAPVTPGNSIVVVVSHNVSGHTFTYTDDINSSPTYQTQAAVNGASSGKSFGAAAFPNSAAGGTPTNGTVTVNTSAGGGILELEIFEVSGGHATTCFDANTPAGMGVASGTSTTPTANTATPSQNGCLAIEFTANSFDTPAGAAGGGFTFAENTANAILATAYDAQAVAAALTPTFTIGASRPWDCGQVFLQPAGGGPDPYLSAPRDLMHQPDFPVLLATA